jgi:hypothetical protein
MSDNPYRRLHQTGGNPEIFRARGARVYTIMGYIFCAGMLYTAFEGGNYSSSANIAFIAFMTLLTFSVFAYIQRPSILFTDIGIGIKNPFSTIVLDWADVIDLETKFVLTIASKHGQIRCWAAAGPSRSQHRRIHPGDLRGSQRGSLEIKAADSPRSDSGAAAHIAQLRINERGKNNGASIEHVWQNHNSSLVAYCICAVAALLAFLIL